MKIEKAIEILTDLLHDAPTYSPEARRNAVSLGSEALKAIKEYRKLPFYSSLKLLPGETEE